LVAKAIFSAVMLEERMVFDVLGIILVAALFRVLSQR
jgi:hypothetical protein